MLQKWFCDSVPRQGMHTLKLLQQPISEMLDKSTGYWLLHWSLILVYINHTAILRRLLLLRQSRLSVETM